MSETASALYQSATDLQVFADKAKALAIDICEGSIGVESADIDIALAGKQAELRALITRDYQGALLSLTNLYMGANQR